MEHNLINNLLFALGPCKFEAVLASELARESRSRSCPESALDCHPILFATEWLWRGTACRRQALDPPSSSLPPEAEGLDSALYEENGTRSPLDQQFHLRPFPALPGSSGLHAILVTLGRRLRARDHRIF